MDTSKLKKYAPQARLAFIKAVTERAAHFGLTAKNIAEAKTEGDVVIVNGTAYPKTVGAQREKLVKRIKEHGFQQTMEAAAYAWFNRFAAIRFMEVNEYLDHGYRVLSHVDPSESRPEILLKAEHVDFGKDPSGKDIVSNEKVIELKLDGTKDEELYRMLLLAQCAALNRVMPSMFESIDSPTQLLMPDNLLHSDSLIQQMVEVLTPEACETVETIGWLYQFYISEKKDDVFAALKKGKKITPENIPAATQLFTPHWIVRYLVENSLGRLWMLNHPDSRLVEQMDYYIRPEEPETDFLRISSPEEIKICDPACGSGHMLTYAFDLLYAIYEEQGYQATDIPRLILTHNLYGIEIDQRAGALAAFALTMKAREKYRRFLTGGKVVQPNICVLENISIDPEDLSAYMDKVGRDLFSGGLQGVVNQWEEADNFGSLIRPLVTDVSEVLTHLSSQQTKDALLNTQNSLLITQTHQKVLKALRQADYLSPKYHVVVANPPYMGVKNSTQQLKAFAKANYPDTKSDLFGMFIERSLELVCSGGLSAMVTMQSWMFLSSFEELRRKFLETKHLVTMAHFGSRAFDTIGGAVVSTTTAVFERKSRPAKKGVFIRVTDGESEAEKESQLLGAIGSVSSPRRFQVCGNELLSIPSNPIAYWVQPKTRGVFSTASPLGEVLDVRQGMATTDNNTYLRVWSELPFPRIGFGCSDAKTGNAAGFNWFPYNKGGEYRKWYGNNVHVVLYEDDGTRLLDMVRDKYPRISDPEFVIKNRGYYFRPSITWSFVGTNFGVRYSDAGYIFDVGGSSAFIESEDERIFFTGLLASNLATHFMGSLNPSLNFQVENVQAIPNVSHSPAVKSQVTKNVKDLIRITKEDWDSFETSWDFERNPMLSHGEPKLEVAATQLRDRAIDLTSRVRDLEVTNNSLLIESYGLADEVQPDVPLHFVSLDCNPNYRYDEDKSEEELEALLLADTMREFISYAVGCMLGRYSLDKPGLILANQGETADDYRQQIPEPTFAPDEDNVIPLLDGDWFEDDITERFKGFLKVTFGTEHYEENLTFLENALYPDNLTGKRRKTIRDYFLKEFFNHHIKLYKKRPIYWLFNSGKHGGFRALIYMHRYNSSTLSRMRTAYVVPLQGKYNTRIDQLEGDIPAATSTSHRKKLETERSQLIKQRDELQAFDEKLRHYADQRIEIDLDDGVKVNYGKFGDLLDQVKAITGNKPEITG